MKKILLYALGLTVSVMVVSALFVFGVFNTSAGTASLIGAEVGALRGSSEIEVHNKIVRGIHDIGIKTKEILGMISVEGDITDENTIKALAAAGSDMQSKIKDLTDIFEGNSFSKDKQVVKDSFYNDYKPAADELSYLLSKLTETPENNNETNTENETEANLDESKIVGEAVSTAKKIIVSEVKLPEISPITADKKTQITNSCAKLIEAHNKFSEILNQKRRY